QRGRLFRRTAGVLSLFALVAIVGVGAWIGQGCASFGTTVQAGFGILCAGVVLGALVWPWVVLEAPGRRSRWLIGPAAGVYLLAATLCLYALRALLWGAPLGCGQ
ncbi:MAG: hypothetical protein M3P04_03990, partial [Actinomycetota bacterium]|nr:hypothetical protein [Actinomycetota bacterium]